MQVNLETYEKLDKVSKKVNEEIQRILRGEIVDRNELNYNIIAMKKLLENFMDLS